MPAHTYMATALAVLAAGAIPVIVDVDESITIDPDAIDSAVGPHTKAVIPVHMWGATCDMDRIMEVAARHGLKVIEDCCHVWVAVTKAEKWDLSETSTLSVSISTRT